VMTLDAGSLGNAAFPADCDREEIFRRAGSSIEEVRAHGDRGHAVALAAKGTAAFASELCAMGRLEGAIAIGGSAGTTIGATALRALPFGMPKVLVSTLASGQTRPYLGGSDIALFPSVADLAGLNRVTRSVLSNAAAALAGMVKSRCEVPLEAEANRPFVTATMFGVTTPCVTRAREVLELSDAEVVVFHATGVGGEAMEALIRDGQVSGVLDLTTTEMADELVGGVLSAGPDRLQAAGRVGVPQVVSVGALDMVNFGPMDTVPERFRGRRLHVHNANITLMRTTRDENAELGRRLVSALRESRGPTAVMLPLKGVSGIDAPGQPFHDPEADAALFEAIRSGLRGHPSITLEERDEHINDPEFAEAAASTLLSMMPAK
jgi:uncharacterized protein (UPF0261 family)